MDNIELKKGVEVVIYPRGNDKLEPEGVATLIERVEVKQSTEKWLVRFKGENRLLKRLIKRLPDPDEPPIKSIMVKLVKDGNLKYYYPNKKTTLGLNRRSHSEFKYQYNKSRK